MWSKSGSFQIITKCPCKLIDFIFRYWHTWILYFAAVTVCLVRDSLARNNIIVVAFLIVPEASDFDSRTLSTIIAFLNFMSSDCCWICCMRKTASYLVMFCQLLLSRVHFSWVLALIGRTVLSHVINRSLVMTSHWLIIIEWVNGGIWKWIGSLVISRVISYFRHTFLFFLVDLPLVMWVTNLLLPRWELFIMLQPSNNFGFRHSERLVEVRTLFRWLVKYLDFHSGLVLLLRVPHFYKEWLYWLLSRIYLCVCIRESTVTDSVGICGVSIQYHL